MAGLPTTRSLIRESIWRSAAAQHQRSVQQLLAPGLTPIEHPLNSGQYSTQSRKKQQQKSQQSQNKIEWTALNPQNPVYNFLIEYYGLKGSKGPRRLARWSPTEWNAESILLEGANEDDLGGLLHVQGAVVVPEGVLYSPGQFFGKGLPHRQDEAARAATAYLWYRAILQQTLSAEPILHCYGLHEWAMQYQPIADAPPPPSAKYQAHLPLRVDQSVINKTVERKGIHCTHVDALRFFAPAAAPLNQYGASLKRIDQLRLEQPACVHAHMDLLKIALRLQPFCGADLLRRVLDLALQARQLDVAASPYDATAYGVPVVPVETAVGRAQYKQEQAALMKRAASIRRELLQAYDTFLTLAFDDDVLGMAKDRPRAERFANAEPGSQPWRKNLIER